MRDQLLDCYASTIFALLEPNIETLCTEAIVFAYPDVHEHMLARFNADYEFEEAASSLWMMNMDERGRQAVAEYFEDRGIDTRFLVLVMHMYNNFINFDNNYPRAWEMFNARGRDALALIRYVVDNDDDAAEECAAAILAHF